MLRDGHLALVISATRSSWPTCGSIISDGSTRTNSGGFCQWRCGRLLFLNPVVNLDQGDGVLKKYIRYCQVHRLKALVEKQSPEAGLSKRADRCCCRRSKSVASLSNEEIADVLSDGELHYDKNRCVFREGDPRTAIIWRRVWCRERLLGDDDRSKFGRKLVQLRDGAGFGEVAFSGVVETRLWSR